MVDFDEGQEIPRIERLVGDYRGLLEELRPHVAPVSRDAVSKILGGLELFYRGLYSGHDSYDCLHQARSDFSDPTKS